MVLGSRYRLHTRLIDIVHHPDPLAECTCAEFEFGQCWVEGDIARVDSFVPEILLQIFRVRGEHSALGVLDDDDLSGSEEVAGQHRRPDRIVGDDTSRVAEAVCVTMPGR